MAKRIAGYVRVSRVAGRQGDSFQSPSAQEDAIRAHCKARRLTVTEVVRELDASGGSMERPRLQRLIAAVEAGKLDGIVVARLDRFARTLLGGVGALEKIHAAGGFVQTVEGGIDTSAAGGAMGELQMNLLLTLAQWERATRAEGFEAAKQRAVERGVHISGKVPVGYVRNGKGARLELDAKKAKVVRAAFELRARGASYGDVCRLLDKRLPGGPSGSGAWNRNTVTRMLSNRVYIGEARQGQHRQPAAHPAIVDERTFDTVQALEKAQPVTIGAGARSLLAGVCRCGSCGYALERNTVGGGYVVYRCRGRSANGVCEAPASAMADALDSHVEALVLARLADSRIEQVAADDDEIDALHAKLAAARAKREPFEDPDYVVALGAAAAGRALSKVDAEIAEIEAAIADAVGATDDTQAIAHDIADIWPTLSTDERREVVITPMVDAITVSRAPRGTALPGRVNVFWRGESVPFARPSRGRRKRTEVVAGVAAA